MWFVCVSVNDGRGEVSLYSNRTRQLGTSVLCAVAGRAGFGVGERFGYRTTRMAGPDTIVMVLARYNSLGILFL